MGAKKQDEVIDLDEILLRQVAERRSPTGSVLEAAPGIVSDPIVAAAAGPEPFAESLPRSAPRQRRAAAEPSGYERHFLCPHVIGPRSAVYVSAKTKAQVTEVVRRLGLGQVSVTTFVENILSHHLCLFRDEINRLYRQRSSKDIL